MNLRELAESDLQYTLTDSENGFGLPVVLISPQGASQSVSGQVLYDTSVFDPETGGNIVVHKPVVTLRRSDLSPVPQPGERWAVKIPQKPSLTADKVTYLLERASEDGQSIGIIRLYLTKAGQS